MKRYECATKEQLANRKRFERVGKTRHDKLRGVWSTQHSMHGYQRDLHGSDPMHWTSIANARK